MAMAKEYYWKKYGAEYDRVIRDRWGLNPFNHKHLLLIGKLHRRNKKRIEKGVENGND